MKNYCRDRQTSIETLIQRKQRLTLEENEFHFRQLFQLKKFWASNQYHDLKASYQIENIFFTDTSRVIDC